MAELKEVIASSWREFTEVEVVKLSYSTWPEDLYITQQIEGGFEIPVNGETVQVYYAPMRLTDEANDELVANERTLTFQGINDVVATYEDLTVQDSEERIQVDVLSYLLGRDGSISNVQSFFTYYVMKIAYSQKSNAASLTIATNPTNQSETGVKFNSLSFPSLKGVE